MTLRLPPELPPALVTLAAGKFPEGDEDALRERARTLRGHAVTYKSLAENHAAVVATLPTAMGGAAAVGAAQSGATNTTNLESLADSCSSLADQCDSTADSIEYAKKVIIVTLVLLAAQLAWDALTFFAGGAVEAPAERLAAEEAVELAGKEAVTRVAEAGAAQAARRAAGKTIMRTAGMGAIWGAAPVLGADAWMAVDHHGNGVDWTQLGIATVAGIGGGIAGGLAGSAIGNRLGSVVGRNKGGYLRHLGVGLAGAVGGGAVGGAVGSVVSLVGNNAVAGAHGQDVGLWHGVGWDSLRDGAVAGIGGGLLGGAAEALRATRPGPGVRAKIPAPGSDGPPPRGAVSGVDVSHTVPGADRPEPTEPDTAHPDPSTAGTGRNSAAPELGAGGPEREVAAPAPGAGGPEREVAAPASGLVGPEPGAVGPEPGVVTPEPEVAGPEREADPERGAAELEPGVTGREPAGRTEEATGKVSDLHGSEPGVRGEPPAASPRPGPAVEPSPAGVRAAGAPGPVGPGSVAAHQDPVHVGAVPGEPGPGSVSARPELAGRGEVPTGPAGSPADAEAGQVRPVVSPAEPVPGAHPDPSTVTTPKLGLASDESAPAHPDPNVTTPKLRVVSDESAHPDPGVVTAPKVRLTQDDFAPAATRAPDDPETGTPGFPESPDDGHGHEAGDPPVGEQVGLPLEVPSNSGSSASDGHRVVVRVGDLVLRIRPGTEVILGRTGDPAAAAHLAGEPTVSQRHAAVRVDQDGRVFIRDLGSTNGTFADNTRLAVDHEVPLDSIRSLRLGPDFRAEISVVGPRLVRFGGEGAHPFELWPGESVLLGRAGDSPISDLVAGSPKVSRQHATVGLDEHGRLWIRDERSTNGTFVGDNRLDPGDSYLLTGGETIGLGNEFTSTIEPVVPDPGAEPPGLHLTGPGGELPLRIARGSQVELGRNDFGALSSDQNALGLASRVHVVVGRDADGRYWIEDRSTNGTDLNNQPLEKGRRYPLSAGDSLRFGSPELHSTAHADPAPESPHDTPDSPHSDSPVPHDAPYYVDPGVADIRVDGGGRVRSLMPGEQVDLVDVAGHVRQYRILPGGGVEVDPVAVIGRDLDGRVWAENHPDGAALERNGEPMPVDQRVYLEPNDKLEFAGKTYHVSTESAPMEVRIFDEGPAVALRRGEAILLGRHPDSPVAEHFPASVGQRHALLYRDENDRLWLRPLAGSPVSIENREISGPQIVDPHDRIRLGDWLGSVDYDRGHIKFPKRIPVQLNGIRSGNGAVSAWHEAHGIVAGGQPIDRVNTYYPPGSRVPVQARASLGVHPSGRAWILADGSGHTFVNDVPVAPDVKHTLRPDDVVRIGAEEFRFSVPEAEGGPLINMVDRSAQSVAAVRDLAMLPKPVFDRISAYLNGGEFGGIVIGHQHVNKLKSGHDYMPVEKMSKSTAGVFYPEQRRIYVDASKLDLFDKGMLVNHEIGHAADRAYDPYGARLSTRSEWQQLHGELMRSVERSKKRGWNSHFETPIESFAEMFAAWVSGPAQLQKSVLGDKVLAQKIGEYFDRVIS
ncbi:FHA domain-containing protein [Nocardia stercoris]|uniref:FHA domain-containing protein n=1 Tax=Nocardia stercoris TaxID=2483361 RepID=UPI0011C42C94|nr:FHA domain-containing protein [Nocardia stercoris]